MRKKKTEEKAKSKITEFSTRKKNKLGDNKKWKSERKTNIWEKEDRKSTLITWMLIST